MQFIRTEGFAQGIADLSQRLADELRAGKHVLWLVSGGSNIPATVEIMQKIPDELTPQLTIMLADERYGPVGHPDSNWQQLLGAGFNGKSAKLLETLQGLSLELTAEAMAQNAGEELPMHDMVIAQLGMGADGHIAGILPGSPAAGENESWSCYYDDPPLQRITLTFPALRQIRAAYLFAYGEAKRQALENLRSQSLPLTEQPAQILKELPEAYVYNDQVGEPA